jgi:hypothetical protein
LGIWLRVFLQQNPGKKLRAGLNKRGGKKFGFLDQRRFGYFSNAIICRLSPSQEAQCKHSQKQSG